MGNYFVIMVCYVDDGCKKEKAADEDDKIVVYD